MQASALGKGRGGGGLRLLEPALDVDTCAPAANSDQNRGFRVGFHLSESAVGRGVRNAHHRSSCEGSVDGVRDPWMV